LNYFICDAEAIFFGDAFCGTSLRGATSGATLSMNIRTEFESDLRRKYLEFLYRALLFSFKNLADLGITKSHSPPYISDDNPYSEAQIKTLKYRPGFPARFGSLADARAHCPPFFSWYNVNVGPAPY
jgi:hypothetical protein